MADNGVPNFWNLESASNFANLFLVFVIGSAVPVLTWVFKKKEAERARHRKEEDERIIKTITAYTDPMGARLKTLEETNTTMLRTLNTFLEKFNEFSDEQKEVNAKVNIMDRIFHDNIKLDSHDRSNRGGRKPSSGNHS